MAHLNFFEKCLTLRPKIFPEMSRGGDLVEEKNDNSASATYASLQDFNLKVRQLIRLVRLKPKKPGSNQLNQEDYREEWKDCRELIDYLLWRFCLNRTDNVELACQAVIETRKLFFDKIQDHIGPKSFRTWAVEEWNAWLVPFNVWLFIEAKKKVQELELKHQELMLGSSAVSLSDKRVLAAINRLARQPSPGQCPLRNYATRIREKVGRKTAEIRRQLSSDNCRKACELILLSSCGFRMADISLSLGVDKSWPATTLYDCLAHVGLRTADVRGETEKRNTPGKGSS